jgi:hypothetical protein
MYKAVMNNVTPLNLLLCGFLGMSVYIDEKIPESEVWIMGLGDDKLVDPFVKITDIKYAEDGQSLLYSAKMKKPLTRVTVNLTPEKEKDNK